MINKRFNFLRPYISVFKVLLGFGFLFLGILFKFSIYYRIGSFFLGLLLVVLEWFNLRKIIKNEEINLKKVRNKFKNNSIKIYVDFNDCEIIENHFNREKKGQSLRMDVYDILFESSIDNAKSLDQVNHCLIKYKSREYNRTFYSHLISIDPKTLKIKLFIKKNTYIFLDKKNNKYFFDLEFLNS